MARTARVYRPSTSGAIIFYGIANLRRKKRQLKGKTQSSQSPSPFPPYTPSVPANRSTSVSDLKPISPAIHSSGAVSPLPSGKFGGLMAVVQDITFLFANVPYIQTVASIVERIIQISEDVRVNQDRTNELIDKVMIYSGVIFDALSTSSSGTEKGISDLKSDLLHIASVLDSIYQALDSLRNSSTLTRVNKIIRRRELLERLAEQDRRLDTLITSFQLKSSIALRVQPDQVTTGQRFKGQEIPSHVPPTRLRGKPEVFGRHDEIEEIISLIQQPIPARIAILGSGGIGKTSLALCVLHDERVSEMFQGRRLFLSCEASQSADHIIRDIMWAVQAPPNLYLGNPLDRLIEELSKSPIIIVLDNLETPWELPTARVGVEDLLRDLADIVTVTLIVTLRGSQRPSSVQWSQLLPPLQPVKLDAAVDIFQSISQKADDFAVKLIQAVDCVPLAVTLLANLAAVDGETTEALWRRWCEESVAMVEGGNDRLNNLEISIEVSLSSPRVQRDADALKLLSLLSLLPDTISSETLCTFENGIPGIKYVKKAISTLIQSALITKDAYGCIRILSPIRLHMRARHPPLPNGRRFVQNYFLELAQNSAALEESPIHDRFRIESSNIEAILLDCLEVPLGRDLEDIVQMLLEFCQQAYLRDIGSTNALSMAAVKLASYTPNIVHSDKTLISKRQERNVISRLTGFWSSRGTPKTIQASITHHDQKAVNQVLKLRGDCFGCLGQVLSRQGRIQEAEESFKTAAMLHEEAGDVSGHAYDLNNMGCLLSRNSSVIDRASSIFEAALSLHEQIGDGAGAAYDLIGRGSLLLQGSAKNAEVAKDLFSRALKLFVDCDDKIGQGTALNALGHFTLSHSKPSEAACYFLQALDLNSEKDDVVGYADSLAGLAYTLLLRSQLLEAKAKVEEAICLRSPTEDPDYLHLLGRIHTALYNFEAAMELFLRAQTLHRQLQDERGCVEDSRYLLEIDFFQGKLLKDSVSSPDDCALQLDQKICEYESHLLPNPYDGPMAVQSSIAAIIRLYTYDIVEGGKWLNRLVESGSKTALELGLYHLHLGSYHLRLGSIDEAELNFRRALVFHTEAENVQGQADDHNKLAEVLLRRGLFQEALTQISSWALRLHTQIGDIAGQGDDLYLQACVYLELGRWDEAEETVQQALEYHTTTSMVRGQGLDLATLSSVMWQKYLSLDHQGEAPANNFHKAALQFLESAADTFTRFVATLELGQCQAQYKAMGKINSDILSTSDALLVPVRVI